MKITHTQIVCRANRSAHPMKSNSLPAAVGRPLTKEEGHAAIAAHRAAGQAAHTVTLLAFIAEIDRLIDAGKPSTHLWNYCVWNRKAVLREMVKYDMSARKVLAHHELLPGRVAANTEALLNDLHACNTSAANEAKIAALSENVDRLEGALTSAEEDKRALRAALSSMLHSVDTAQEISIDQSITARAALALAKQP